ncbi:hypothetical protein ATANTOWER_010388 [Ataeniobius toweri]|uniref:Uncharacterized protein n=1 Tax=Ataeniobius toweri TaxID=208326 RepID=A0ABU7B1Q6_9TELE|nr:hypothetical protein [Ataeniobius toweri]
MLRKTVTKPIMKPVQPGSLMGRTHSGSPHCCYGTEGSKPDHPNADITSTSVHCNKQGGEGGVERAE